MMDWGTIADTVMGVLIVAGVPAYFSQRSDLRALRELCEVRADAQRQKNIDVDKVLDDTQNRLRNHIEAHIRVKDIQDLSKAIEDLKDLILEIQRDRKRAMGT